VQFHLASSSEQRASAASFNLAPFVRADLTLDIPAIKSEAKARYARKLDFINRYTGPAKRYWQRAQARRAIADAWKGAREQRHRIVQSRMPIALPYTRSELSRQAVLLGRMASAPVSVQGNATYRDAASEYRTISQAAQRRAYGAILANARRA
jgi:hypothetical protein